MNSYQVSNAQQRFSCAAVAVLASTLVLSGVLWLFASDSASTAGAPTAIVKQEPASPGAQQVAGRLPAGATSIAKL